MTRPRWPLVAMALLLGAALRLAWSQDIEYKSDERYTFELVRRAPALDAVPAVGMPSGVGVVNPGASVWAFLALGRMFGPRTPPELARAVQLTNIAAIGALLMLALQVVQRTEQTAWLWAVAFVSVNPIAVLLHRKIWAQSLLPLVCVLLLASWFRRDRAPGALGWGFFGMLLGQIHMTGFFWAAALWLWTLLFGRRLREPRPIVWAAWGIGTGTAAVGLIPWARVLLASHAAPASPDFLGRLTQPLLASRFWQLWITDSLGLGLSYNLGTLDFGRFLTLPVVGGHATYLIGMIHGLVIALAAVVAVEAFRSARAAPLFWRALFTGDGSETSLLVASAFWGYGALLTATGFEVYPHYLITTFPLVWVSLAVVAGRAGRSRLLAALWVCQLLLSLAFLSYIHVQHGARSGDYGPTYGSQR